jgi:hypothetical protein
MRRDEGGGQISHRLRSVLFVALAILVIAIVAPAADAARRHRPSLELVSPHGHQVIQRGDDGRGDILLAGRALGLGRRLEARWGSAPWVRFSCGRDGRFSHRLGALPAGQATLQVRGASRHDVIVSRPYVGIGDIYVIAGQSNASGRGGVASSYSNPVLKAALFGNDDRWKDLTDPVDSPEGQVDRISLDQNVGGSVWPLVATELMAAEGVPVAFVPCARGATPVRRWTEHPEAPHSRSTLYGSMLRRVEAVGGRVRAVLFWQGEADARESTPEETYAVALHDLAAAVTQDCGAPLVVAQIGDFDPGSYPAEGVDAVRFAQQEAWRAGWALPGPALYDIDLSGHVHFRDADDELVAARRWAAAILAAVLHREVPSAPRLEGALYDGEGALTLHFDCGGASLRPGQVGGLVVRGAGEPLQVAGSVTSADTVTLLLEGPPNLPLTVSLGQGREAAGQLVPAEGSPWALPAQVFVGAPVDVPVE